MKDVAVISWSKAKHCRCVTFEDGPFRTKEFILVMLYPNGSWISVCI